jgi:hypothetical protein
MGSNKKDPCMNPSFQRSQVSRGTCEDVRFVASAFADLVAFVGHAPPETGGLLLGSRQDYVVKKFIFDESGSRSYASYDPDVTVLNKIVKHEWEEHGLQLIGWAHSHPRGIERLSGDYGAATGDIGYLNSIFRAMPALSKFIVPIIFSTDDGPLAIYPYVAYRDRVEGYRLGRLVVLPANSEEAKREREPAATQPVTSSLADHEAATSARPEVNEKERAQDESTRQSISISA